MPYSIHKLKSGKEEVTSPNGVKSYGSTPRNAMRQVRLLEAVDHDPNFKPRHSKNAMAKRMGMAMLACLLMLSPALAMEHHTQALQDQNGRAIGAATVSVYVAGTTTLATIYSDNGLTIKANPFSTRADGTYDFYAANGKYDLVFFKRGYTFLTGLYSGITLFDVNDFGGGGGGGVSNFGQLLTGTNTAATMTVGTGSALSFSGSGAINANQFKGNGTVAVADGGTGLTTAVDDAVNIGNGTALVSTVLPSCSNATTSKLLYNTSTNAFSCGTDQSTGGGTTFDSIGTGTNVTATMTCGTGCSLLNSGTGLIVFTAGRPNVTTVNAGNSPYSALNTDFEILCDTTAAGRSINLPAATSKAFFRVKNLGANSCTINRAGTDLIDGATSAVLRTQYEAVDLVADTSANWEVH